MGSRIVAHGAGDPAHRDYQSGPRTRTGHLRRMDPHAHRNRPALRDVAAANRWSTSPPRPATTALDARRDEGRRARRDRGRHGFFGVRLSFLRLPAAASPRHRFDSRLRRCRGLLGLRLRAHGGRLFDARGRLARGAGDRRGRAFHDGRLERSRTAVLFGDGAGAAVMVTEPGPRGVLASLLRSSGEYWELLSVRNRGSPRHARLRSAARRPTTRSR